MGLIIIGVSITFDFARSCIFINISIYGVFAPVEARPTYDGAHAASFLKTKNIRLKEICDQWDSFLETEARRINGKGIETQEELNEDIVKIAAKQMETCGEIENILSDAYTDLNKYKATFDDDTVINNYLIFISNCFQLIRDLTMTFAFGNLEIQNRHELNATSKRISEDLTKTYKRRALGKQIMARKDKSEEILNNRAKIAKYKEDLQGFRESMEAGIAEREDIVAAIKRGEENKDVIPDMLHDLAEEEQTLLAGRIERLRSRQQQLSEKADDIKKEIESLKHGKKRARPNLLILANDYEKLALEIEKRILETEKEIGEIADCADRQHTEYCQETNREGDRLTIIDRKLSRDANQVDELLDEVRKAEEREIVLAKDFAEIMADWPDMDFSYEDEA